MALAGDNRSIPNCLFLNAQNKQTVPSIVKPLREMGIPAAGIVDLDVLKEGGQVWTKQILAAGIPNPQHEALGNLRKKILNLLNAANENWKSEGGVAVLEGDDLEAANNLMETLEEYGIFVVRDGELESWLKQLGAAGHGSNWLVGTFEKMGENPEDPAYIKPSDGDVWDFLANIRGWMLAGGRKGIPA